MTVNKTQAVEFLVALGFAKAVGWKDELLVSRLGQLPSKIEEGEVPDGFEDLFEKISNSDPDEEITFEGAKKPKKKKAVTKAEPEPKKEKPKPIAKKKAPAKKEKSKPGAKKAAPAKVESEVVERDKFGSRVGTISAKVNGAITSEWKEGKEIAKELKISFTQARARLYHANQEGIVECRRLVQYRLAKKKK